MATKRRYEILLPVLDNAGEIQPAANFEAVEERLLNFFGGFTNCGKVRGEWAHGESVHRDELIKVSVDIDDTPWNRERMKALKMVTQEAFKQVELYVTSYVVEVI